MFAQTFQMFHNRSLILKPSNFLTDIKKDPYIISYRNNLLKDYRTKKAQNETTTRIPHPHI